MRADRLQSLRVEDNFLSLLWLEALGVPYSVGALLGLTDFVLWVLSWTLFGYSVLQFWQTPFKEKLTSELCLPAFLGASFHSVFTTEQLIKNMYVRVNTVFLAFYSRSARVLCLPDYRKWISFYFKNFFPLDYEVMFIIENHSRKYTETK